MQTPLVPKWTLTFLDKHVIKIHCTARSENPDSERLKGAIASKPIVSGHFPNPEPFGHFNILIFSPDLHNTYDLRIITVF